MPERPILLQILRSKFGLPIKGSQVAKSMPERLVQVASVRRGMQAAVEAGAAGSVALVDPGQARLTCRSSPSIWRAWYYLRP
jgi:hypothetical protein